MTENNSSSIFFNDTPIQWGFRGDPLLWQEMKTKMETVAVPASAKELEKILHHQFLELTGQNAKRGKSIFVSRYNTGGMSSGIVSSDFWLDEAFPLIIECFIKTKN